MKDALSIHRLLLEHQTAHEIVRLPRPIAAADELPEVLGLPPARCLCTRVFAACGDGVPAGAAKPCDLIAVIVVAGTRPAAEVVAGALALPAVHPAPACLVNEITDYAAGLVAPLLLPPEMPMLVDQAAASVDDVVYTATGEACTAVGIHTLDLFALCDVKAVPIRCAATDPGPYTDDR